MKYLLLILTLVHTAAFADLDKDQKKGLDDTKALLKDRGQRDAFIKTDKNAKAADDRVDALVGSGANKDEMYGISADVMEKLTTSANGDPEKMKQILNDATKDPEGFYNKYFDDKAKGRVRDISGKIGSPSVGSPK